jgi:extracellular elastinolytic metalloproteinase
MGCTKCRGVKIPVVMVTNTAGLDLLAQRLAQSTTVSRNSAVPSMLDSSFDSDVVFHEYGHGLTWRMVGSMSGPIAGAIGEGASDVLAFLLAAEQGVTPAAGLDVTGEYLAGAGGIRRYRFAGYPLTYSSWRGTGVHADGEIYAAALYRVLENVNASLGGDQALAAATVLRLFVQGLKLTPAGPKPEDMRAGLLGAIQADATATAEQKTTWTCNVWEAFAHFGIGQGSSIVLTGSTSTAVTQSFACPAALACGC